MEHKSMYWADQIARKVVEEFPNEKEYTVAAGITPSGTIHIGNFREIITVDIIYRSIRNLGKKVRFIYSWDDYDRIRKVPKNIPNPKKFEKYMYMPGVDAPDPWGCDKSYTEHFEQELIEQLPKVGIKPQYIYQNKMYRGRKYADQIRFVLSNRFEIRNILNKYRTEPLPGNWYPVAVYCEKCNREKTKVLDWDNKYTLKYECNSCGFEAKTNFKKEGLTKLGWRTDWPMRWIYENVSCEGGGKDHNSPGAGLDTGHVIVKEVYKKTPPVRFMYDFITIKGAGGKMSSSLGNVITLGDTLGVYLPEVVRYLFAGTRPQTEFSLSFNEDIFKVYEDFYDCEQIYYGKKQVNKRDRAHWSRVYEMSCVGAPAKKMLIQPNFKHCVELINIYRSPKKALKAVNKSEKLRKSDSERYLAILKRAKNWLKKYAPEKYKFELQEKPDASNLSKEQKSAVKDLAKELGTKKNLKDVFGKVAQDNDLKFKKFFTAVYTVLFGKKRGPRLVPFVQTVGRKKIANILKKA